MVLYLEDPSWHGAGLSKFTMALQEPVAGTVGAQRAGLSKLSSRESEATATFRA
jgi:hypothetical protein